jgi:hypothetical protein
MLLIVVLPFVLALLVALLLRKPLAAARRVTEPSCGKCGYCVRGLQSSICPECGSDLRVAGILAPGDMKPLSRRMRLLMWTCSAPFPAFMLATLAAISFAPWETTTTHQRVFFSHVPGATMTVRIEQTGQRIDWGRRRVALAAPNKIRLTLESLSSTNVLDVNLDTRSYGFAAANGSRVFGRGAPTTRSVGEWLAAHKFSVDSAAEVAGYIHESIDLSPPRMGNGFIHFLSAGKQPRAVAHPASLAQSTARPLPIATYFPYGFAALVWLIGLPFVLRASRVQFTANADQA